MRGLYTHVSQTMRAKLTGALQSRWEDSLRVRAAIDPHSPVPLLDKLLAPYRAPTEPPAASESRRQAKPCTQNVRVTGMPKVSSERETRSKLISQIPPTHERNPHR
jgi:hypothetical protein